MGASHRHLLELLGQGWQIQPPVFVRSRWWAGSMSARGDTYHFVLWSGEGIRLVSVAESPEVVQLVMDSGLSVDRQR
jgi:hypothetical protein